MKFKYGDTLRIRSDLYTILGKIRYIDTHGAIGYKYKLVKHKNNAEFWIRWDKQRGAYQFTKLCGKAMPSDMNVGTSWLSDGYRYKRDIDTDIDIGAFSRYEEYEDDNGTHILTIEKRVHTTEYSKGVYVDKKYVLLESNAEITKPILDKMDTVKKVRFIGPIIWFLANFFKNK